jgi:hypothetical protein
MSHTQIQTKDVPTPSSTSPALLFNGDILGVLLFCPVDDHGILIEFSWNAGLITVGVLRCVDDGLLIEGFGQNALGCCVAERGMVGGNGGGGEEGDEDLHDLVGCVDSKRRKLLSAEMNYSSRIFLRFGICDGAFFSPFFLAKGHWILDILASHADELLQRDPKWQG